MEVLDKGNTTMYIRGGGKVWEEIPDSNVECIIKW